MAAVTVQLKALSRETLNVVGEDHAESDLPGRRAIEKDIAKQEADGGYWHEDEFKARDFVWQEQVRNIFPGEAPRPAADPLILRANYGSVFLRNGADRLLRWHAAKNPADIDESAANKADVLATLRGSCNSIAAGFRFLLKLSEASERPEELERISESERSALRALVGLAKSHYDFVIALARRFAEHTELSAIHADLGKHQEFLTKVRQTMDDSAPILLQRAQEKWSGPLQDQDAREKLTGTSRARFLRSMEMGSAGDTRHTTKGIWKVGAGHIDDIVNSKILGKYTLLTREDLNAEYAKKYKLPLKEG